jgi:hypothetical protein
LNGYDVWKSALEDGYDVGNGAEGMEQLDPFHIAPEAVGSVGDGPTTIGVVPFGPASIAISCPAHGPSPGDEPTQRST